MTPKQISDKLTDYQIGQLRHIHFMGDFNYKACNGKRTPAKAWRIMVKTLHDTYKLIVCNNGTYLTKLGNEVLMIADNIGQN